MKTFPLKKMVLIILITSGLIISSLVMVQKPSTTPQTLLHLNSDLILGNPRGNVEIIQFTDFQCPACKKFVEETKPEIEKEYIATGRLKFVVKHFPLNTHPFAPRAAEAAECAGQQNKFWDYHDLLYKNQVGISEGTWTQLGSQVKLEATVFADCLGGTFRERVASDRALAQRLKLNGTPTFFIGTETADGQFRARQAVNGGKVLLELLRSEVPEIERSLAR